MDKHFLAAYQFSCIVSIMVVLGCTAYDVWRRKDMMKMQVDKVVRVVDSQAIPDGEFLGIWGGFDARFEAGGCIFIAKTKAAMKGNVPCTVVVSRGKVVVRTERRYG